FGSMVTMFLSLFVIGVFMYVGYFVDKLAEEVEGQVTISAYIGDDADPATVYKVKEYIQDMPEVNFVIYISKEDAWVKFSETLSPEMAALVDPDILPAKFEIELADSQQIEQVAVRLQTYDSWRAIADNPFDPGESIKYSQKTVQSLFNFTNFMRILGIALIGLMVFIALVFVNNTIRLSILARRKEIAIMKLVGASNGFVRGPFIMESVLHAFLGSVLAIGALEIIRRYFLADFLASIQLFSVGISNQIVLYIYGALFAISILLALFGSFLSMRKHLKV
ncbi:MAG: ABC transporter permease, partial [Eggerthellaceae bacterium]|nr:ABC transporter permease [Eggerthellaceae bacterium]